MLCLDISQVLAPRGLIIEVVAYLGFECFKNVFVVTCRLFQSDEHMVDVTIQPTNINPGLTRVLSAVGFRGLYATLCRVGITESTSRMVTSLYHLSTNYPLLHYILVICYLDDKQPWLYTAP